MRKILLLVEMKDEDAEFNSEAFEDKVSDIGRLCDYEFIDGDDSVMYEVNQDTLEFLESYESW